MCDPVPGTAPKGTAPCLLLESAPWGAVSSLGRKAKAKAKAGGGPPPPAAPQSDAVPGRADLATVLPFRKADADRALEAVASVAGHARLLVHFDKDVAAASSSKQQDSRMCGLEHVVEVP